MTESAFSADQMQAFWNGNFANIPTNNIVHEQIFKRMFAAAAPQAFGENLLLHPQTSTQSQMATPNAGITFGPQVMSSNPPVQPASNLFDSLPSAKSSSTTVSGNRSTYYSGDETPKQINGIKSNENICNNFMPTFIPPFGYYNSSDCLAQNNCYYNYPMMNDSDMASLSKHFNTLSFPYTGYDISAYRSDDVKSDIFTGKENQWPKTMLMMQNTGSDEDCITKCANTVAGRRSTTPKSGKRVLFNPTQVHALERAFRNNKFIKPSERTEMANRIGLTSDQVKIWFQNRRYKQNKIEKEAQFLLNNPTIPQSNRVYN